jgi:hypothetical protein
MVYELLRNCFVPDDLASGFNLFFEICAHISHGHVPPSISHLFVALQLLALEKQAKGVRPMIYWLVTRTLVIQFKNTSAKHFSLHQFKVAMPGKCKTMVHGLKLCWIYI